MNPTAHRTLLSLALVATMLVVSASPSGAQPQSKSQQKCINKMNKSGEKVCRAQGKNADACIKGFFKGQLAGSAQDCLAGDLKGKIAKAHTKTINAEASLCPPLLQPDFAFASATIVNAAASGESIALVADVFGPDLDTALTPGNEKCQRKVQKGYEKIRKEKLKIFLKCKKEQLKLGVATGTGLANACMSAIIADAKGKIAKRIVKLGDDLTKHCPSVGGPLDILFPGKCAGQPNQQAWAVCIDVEVEGRVCEKLSQMDAFAFDCDLFDDGVVCNSGDQNGAETDVDCGGPTCPVCADGLGCGVAADCQSTVCTGNVCQAPTCSDGVLNADESDIDCGGLTCAACPAGAGCSVAADCDSSVCVGNICQAATCSDGVQNSDESDIDCGGLTCAACPAGAGCSVAADCDSSVCVGNICQAPTCSDGVKNGDEGDIDCGGLTCAACLDGSGCNVGADCQSGACVTNICQVPSCVDGVLNGDETDIDCGGLTCAACPAGSICAVPADCQSIVCTGNVCQPVTCVDGVQNGDESDIDCGGATCAGCPVGGNCGGPTDCASSVCTGSVCQAPTCSDGAQNGTETDIDCGGSCSVCELGDGCLVPGDCRSASCVGSICTCGNQNFTFNVSSNTGGVFDSAEWPGGTQVDTTVDPACSVTINNPTSNLDLICTLAAPFSINGFTGFSNCFGSGGQNGDGCQALTCPSIGSPTCCATRPSCSVALNGSGSARYLVQCLD